jgi:hypothetical protein
MKMAANSRTSLSPRRIIEIVGIGGILSRRQAADAKMFVIAAEGPRTAGIS